MPALVLASGSPRRRQFLTDLGLPFEVRAADVDESVRPGEAAEPCARRLANAKALAVAGRHAGVVVLAADTVVTLGSTILGKPEDEADFRRMMNVLSGAVHQVITAVAVHSPAAGAQVIAVSTDVRFRPLTPDAIEWYWRTGEPRDKAGGYAIQGLGGAFVERIDGSHSNVIGLPLVETLALLERAGVRPPWDRP